MPLASTRRRCVLKFYPFFSYNLLCNLTVSIARFLFWVDGEPDGACLLLLSLTARGACLLLLSQNVADDVSVDICETEISSLEAVDEFFVVNPEEV